MVLFSDQRPFDQSQLALMRSVFGVEQAYASNALEGSTLTLKETQLYLAYGITAKGKPLRDHLEVSGHEAAMRYVYELADLKSKRPLTEVDIRQMHNLLFVVSWNLEPALRDKVGKYKVENNHVLTKSGKIRYYAEVQAVPGLMREFVDFFNRGAKKIHPIEAAALIHHKFTAIHPFSDGNGRMARILSNLHLIIIGWPSFIIQPTARERYYYCLEQADNGRINFLYKFFAETIEKSIDVALRILKKTYQPTSAKHAVYHLRRKRELTQLQLAKKSGVSQERISRIENNKEPPGDKTLLKLAKALGCPVSDL
jgi:Fic family protein